MHWEVKWEPQKGALGVPLPAAHCVLAERMPGEKAGMPDEAMWDILERLFGYDPEDQADDWWVGWGSVQERMAGMSIAEGFSVQVYEDCRESE